MRLLRRRQFGNPILRQKAERLDAHTIRNAKTQDLIANMRVTLERKKYGVGIAAPQVGVPYALSVISIKPTPTRPNLEHEELTIINPIIIKTYGARAPMWEGCISGPELYAQVPRYEKIRLEWFDEQARKHHQDFEGFMAHVIQHEVDHLEGILFVDKVVDPKSYMTFAEYKKMKKYQNDAQ